MVVFSNLPLTHLEVLLQFLNVSIGFSVVDYLVFENELSNSALIDDMIAYIRIFHSFRSGRIFLSGYPVYSTDHKM